MVFYPILGWGVFWISLIIGIILFISFRKVYPIIYLISVALYIFTAGFTIDVFNFEKLGILTTLIISAVLFMVLGYYFSRVINFKQLKK
ncbi:MAG: hypothetical protein AABX54_04615 [Nanoarchaeota archaeon]